LGRQRKTDEAVHGREMSFEGVKQFKRPKETKRVAQQEKYLLIARRKGGRKEKGEDVKQSSNQNEGRAMAVTPGYVSQGAERPKSGKAQGKRDRNELDKVSTKKRGIGGIVWALGERTRFGKSEKKNGAKRQVAGSTTDYGYWSGTSADGDGGFKERLKQRRRLVIKM